MSKIVYDDSVALVHVDLNVPQEIHKLADYNLSITKEPHSEVSALGVFLDHLNKQNL